MFIPDFIELLNLPPSDAFRAHLIDTLEAQCAALWRIQDDEASATAGFAYGILKGVRKRFISKDYGPIALKAVNAVLKRIDASGELKDVSFGTGMGHDLQDYKDIPLTSMPYGQSRAVMLLVELLQRFR
ncbi:glycoside hydrolase family 105 protein [Dothistroma septosporum NZE10]|uniref:Glycoside hydrolase family 105 protein n=1 Tax=Dothistroma septosporum (strain NZE10 / CBS 128990) TaxID=675120 RepID=N1PCE6_DOTSN|nr:glycoside hydrolase family 105 protein [Dothistroma septosporum NZE10]